MAQNTQNYWRRVCFLPRVLLATALALPCALAAVAQDAEPPAEQPPARAYSHPVVIRFEGMIGPMLEQYFYRKLEVAEARGADLLIVEIESPGGYRVTSVNIAERLRDLQWARTVAYVPRDAISGAAIVSLGCDEIVMGPEARIGDAGLIEMGSDGMFRHVEEKVRSVLARQVRDLADAKGRPPAIAEAMVDMNLIVYQVKNADTGAEAFMSQHEIDSSDDPAKWEKIKPVLESREKTFLTVNGRRAVELKLADAVVVDLDEVKSRYGWTGELTVFRYTGVDTAVYILNHPLMTGLLVVIGIVALLAEFSAPGISIGGLIAGLCFTLFFWSRFLGGTAGWLEVVLFATGAVFLAVEIFVIPGFGVAGISGILLMAASLVMASHHFIIPATPQQWGALGQTLLAVIGSGAGLVAALLLVSYYRGSIPLLDRFTLPPPKVEPAFANIGGDADKAAPTSKAGVGVGDWGVADSPLRPAGKAMFGDEYLDVVTEGSFVEKGRQVRILKISGNRIVVREVES